MGRSCFPSALTKEPGDGLTRTVLLVDPPLNPNNPIVRNTPAGVGTVVAVVYLRVLK